MIRRSLRAFALVPLLAAALANQASANFDHFTLIGGWFGMGAGPR
jgi:hypothetical protein